MDFDQIKKMMLNEAYMYNIHEQNLKEMRKATVKERELEEFKAINRRVSTELNIQNQRERQRKNYLQGLLAKDYQRHIQEKRLQSVEEMKKNRSYAEREQQNQKQYHERRSRELARIIRGQRSFKSVNPQLQEIVTQKKINSNNQNNYHNLNNHNLNNHNHINHNNNIGHHINQSLTQKKIVPQYTNEIKNPVVNIKIQPEVFKFEPVQRESSSRRCTTEAVDQKLIQSPVLQMKSEYQYPNFKETSNQNHNQVTQNQINYKDYLREQIDKKKHQKEEQIKQRVQIEKELNQSNNDLMKKQEQIMREIQRRQQLAYKKGLDEQIAQRNIFRSFH